MKNRKQRTFSIIFFLVLFCSIAYGLLYYYTLCHNRQLMEQKADELCEAIQNYDYETFSSLMQNANFYSSSTSEVVQFTDRSAQIQENWERMDTKITFHGIHNPIEYWELHVRGKNLMVNCWIQFYDETTQTSPCVELTIVVMEDQDGNYFINYVDCHTSDDSEEFVSYLFADEVL